MNNFGIVALFLIVGFLGIGNGWAAQTLTAKGSDSVIAKCIKDNDGFKTFIDVINAQRSDSKSTLSQKCNAQYKEGCSGLCFGTISTGKALKNELLNLKTKAK